MGLEEIEKKGMKLIEKGEKITELSNDVLVGLKGVDGCTDKLLDLYLNGISFACNSIYTQRNFKKNIKLMSIKVDAIKLKIDRINKWE